MLLGYLSLQLIIVLIILRNIPGGYFFDWLQGPRVQKQSIRATPNRVNPVILNGQTDVLLTRGKFPRNFLLERLRGPNVDVVVERQGRDFAVGVVEGEGSDFLGRAAFLHAHRLD